jgi:hypothetical protein
MSTISKKSSETLPLVFDYTSQLGLTETIVSQVLTVNVISGVDPSAAAMVTAGVITSGPTLHQVASTVTAGIYGVQYQIDCVITTSLARTLKVTHTIEIISASSARQHLADFCLRQLGAPVINIEVADEQLQDCIEMAIQYYHEYHFDGIERDYLVYKIVGTTLTVANGALFNVGDVISSTDNQTYASVSAINGNVLTINKQQGFVKFVVGQTVKNYNHIFYHVGGY